VFLLAPLHGFAFWFDVEFNGPVRQKPKKQATLSMDGSTQDASPSSKKKKPDVSIVLSTAPEDAPTHWQQVI
jgi:type I protein arginine methyltransferase